MGLHHFILEKLFISENYSKMTSALFGNENVQTLQLPYMIDINDDCYGKLIELHYFK